MIDSVLERLVLDLQNPYWRVALILVCALVLALVARLVLMPALRRLSRRTASSLDDHVLDLLWPAILRTIVLQGVHVATLDFVEPGTVETMVIAATSTLMVLIWGRVLAGTGAAVFRRMSDNADQVSWIQPQTLPLVQFAYKVALFGLMSYLVMAAWHIDLTSWLASAGVAGIALGFAAKDTLANFISGVFILADAPYRVGQFIIIDDVTRGVVTEIGMRSTRLLTRDNVEVTVPNAVIGNAKIVNESSGPSPLMRVRIDVGVAYGSDVDAVRGLLLECTRDLAHTADSPEAAVRFTAMADSSLQFQVLVWLRNPVFRGRVIDELNTRIYKALGAAGIAIPFPQRDLHIKSWPADGAGFAPRAD
jgi:small-conductance mechanosensitive channel